MSVAPETLAPWNTRDYRRIVSASHRAGILTVGYGDGATVDVDVEVFRERPGVRDWDRVTHTEHEIVVPREEDDDEIPWDVIRLLTDPAFDQYWGEQAAAAARRSGERIRKLRRAQRLGEDELAARAGIAPARLRRIERGEDGTSLPTLERIVGAMGHDMGVFVVREQEDEAQAEHDPMHPATDRVGSN